MGGNHKKKAMSVIDKLLKLAGKENFQLNSAIGIDYIIC